MDARTQLGGKIRPAFVFQRKRRCLLKCRRRRLWPRIFRDDIRWQPKYGDSVRPRLGLVPRTAALEVSRGGVCGCRRCRLYLAAEPPLCGSHDEVAYFAPVPPQGTLGHFFCSPTAFASYGACGSERFDRLETTLPFDARSRCEASMGRNG